MLSEAAYLDLWIASQCNVSEVHVDRFPLLAEMQAFIHINPVDVTVLWDVVFLALSLHHHCVGLLLWWPIVLVSSALGQTLLLSAALQDKVVQGRDVYHLIDWSHEHWIHHLNGRAPLSSHLLPPALSFLSREMSVPLRPSSPHQAFSQPARGEGRNVISSQ